MPKHDWHYTDEELGGNKRRRTIRNWLNYRDPQDGWHRTNPRLRAADAGDTFLGMDLRWVGDSNPLSFFVGHKNDLGGRPWWGIRKSDDPDSKGVVFFIENGVDSDNPTRDDSKRQVTFTNVLPDTDLYLYSDVAQLSKWIALNTNTSGDAGDGKSVTIGIFLPNSWDLDIPVDNVDGNYFRILKNNGEEVYSSLPATAVDSSTLGPFGGPRRVPCRFNRLAKGTLNGQDYFRVKIQCRPAGFTRPILMDPSTTISGGTLVETTMLRAGTPTLNWGGYTDLYSWNGLSNDWFLARLTTPAIPNGMITNCTMYGYGSSNPQTWSAYRIVPTSIWKRGTQAANVASIGECNVNYANYNSLTWAAGDFSASDYVADASPPTMSIVPGNWNTLVVPNAWVSGWKSGAFYNNGFVCLGAYATYGSIRNSSASPNGTYFTIDYSSGDTPDLTNPTRFGPWREIFSYPFFPQLKKKSL